MTPDGARPYGIMVDAQDRPWFDLFGTNRWARSTPRRWRSRSTPCRIAPTRPRRIALTSDGGVWYVDYSRGYLGRLDPATGATKEWKNPGGATSLPYAMTVDDADRLWFVETGSSRTGWWASTPRPRSSSASSPIPGGGGTIRHMIFDPKARVIWFGTDNNTIGRATVPAAKAITS